MSTPALIGQERSDDSVIFITVQWDGYDSLTGNILRKHYGDSELASGLVALGDLSQVQPRLSPFPGEAHSFAKPAPGICIAYHRDRGEELSIGKAEDIADFKRIAREYPRVYLFADGEWKTLKTA